MTDGSDDGTARTAFVRAFHESAAIADLTGSARALRLTPGTTHPLGGRAGQGANVAPESALVDQVLVTRACFADSASRSMCERLTPASPVGAGIIKGNALHHSRAKFKAR